MDQPTINNLECRPENDPVPVHTIPSPLLRLCQLLWIEWAVCRAAELIPNQQMSVNEDASMRLELLRGLLWLLLQLMDLLFVKWTNQYALGRESSLYARRD